MSLPKLFAPIDAGFLVTLMLVAFSGVYLTKLGVSPIYFTSVAGVIGVVAMALGASTSASATAWANAIGVTLACLAMAVYEVSLNCSAGNIVNLVLGPVLGVVVPLTGRSLDRRQLAAIARVFVVCTILVAAADTAWRATHPDFQFLSDTSQRVDADELAFYAYKLNSVMYLDSNFSGLQLALQFAFLFALRKEGVRMHWLWFVLTFVLTVGTLSRASVAACIALLGLLLYQRYGRGVIMKAITVAICAGAAFGAYIYVKNDYSFATKFDILGRFSDYEAGARWSDVLFGNGVGHAVIVLGIGAHNIVVTYLIELGAVASAAVVLWWLRASLATPSITYLVFVWLVNGFSLTTLANPYMYASAALLLLLHRQRGAAPTGPVRASTLQPRLVQA